MESSYKFESYLVNSVETLALLLQNLDTLIMMTQEIFSIYLSN